MKIVLVNPLQNGLVSSKGRIYNRTWPPLDLANTAAILRERGHDLAIVDANAEKIGPAEVARRCGGSDQVFITSSSLDRWQCPHLDLTPFLSAVTALRANAPELYVLGAHGTVRPAELLEATQARAIVRGEPEGVVREIAARKPLSEIRGITYRDHGGIMHNPDARAVDLEDLPLPTLDLLPMHLYRYEVMGNSFTLFEMSRGCASKCTFCLLKTYGTGVRRNPLNRLQAEIETAILRHGIRKAYFIDLEFTILRQQVIELCDWLIEKKFDFEWCCQTRFDLVDDELLRKMRSARCTLIHFGVEAGSDQLLSRINKGITMEQIRTGMRMVKNAGIRTACFFMVGFPHTTKADMDDIQAFARELAPDYPLFHIAAPYPGTALYEQVKNDPDLRFSDNSLFPEAVEGALSLHDLKKMTRMAYVRYYGRPCYIMARMLKGEWTSLAREASLFGSLIAS